MANGPTVLVVEDHAGSRESLAALVRQLGGRVVAAGTLEAAVEKIRLRRVRGHPLDLVLLDTTLPEVESPEAVGRLRNVLDGSTRIAFMAPLAGAGANPPSTIVDDMVLKPVRLRDIAEVLRPGSRQEEASLEDRAPAVATDVPSGPARILLAEDNPVNQEVARGMLEALGCEVETVDNGAEAVEALAHGAYDLVFMDCMMPVMDGYLATARIRERDCRARDGNRLPVIALTANAMHSDREQCLAAGMDDHLAKPYGIDAVRRTLARWTGRTETERA